MPYVNVRIIEDNVTVEQKLRVIERITQVLVEELHKDPAGTFVVIDEVPRTLNGKKCEVPVKKILAGADPSRAVSSGALRNPDSLAPFIALR